MTTIIRRIKFGCGQAPQSDDFLTGSVSIADRRRKLVGRLLRGCNDRHFRDTLRYLAAAESFDRSLFEELVLNKTVFAPSGFDHLVSYSFVQTLEEGRYRLHPRMREVLMEDLRPTEYRSIHDFYFRYYDLRCRPSSPRAIAPVHEFALSSAAQYLLVLDEARFPVWLDELVDVVMTNAHLRFLPPLYERSLAISEKALGPDHPDVAIILNNIGMLYNTQGRYEAVLPLYEWSLAIREKTLGLGHPDVAQSLNNIAVLYNTQGQYEKAEPLYMRSLAIREETLGPDHPDVAKSLDNIAGLYRSMDRNKEAKDLEKREARIHAITR